MLTNASQNVPLYWQHPVRLYVHFDWPADSVWALTASTGTNHRPTGSVTRAAAAE